VTLAKIAQLITYLENGRINIDNNRVERSVKTFVIGRNNWMFNDNYSGSIASVRLYSIIEIAKANNLEPTSYITLCL